MYYIHNIQPFLHNHKFKINYYNNKIDLLLIFNYKIYILFKKIKMSKNNDNINKYSLEEVQKKNHKWWMNYDCTEKKKI